MHKVVGEVGGVKCILFGKKMGTGTGARCGLHALNTEWGENGQMVWQLEPEGAPAYRTLVYSESATGPEPQCAAGAKPA